MTTLQTELDFDIQSIRDQFDCFPLQVIKLRELGVDDEQIKSLTTHDATKRINELTSTATKSKKTSNTPKVPKAQKVSNAKPTPTISSDALTEYEDRFKLIANLDGDLSQYPLTQETHLQVKTDKEKSDTFGEVFTPLWLVDKMIEQTSLINNNQMRETTDLCSGYGQYTIRLMRAFYTKHSNIFSISEFFNNHTFAEFQYSSCFKLIFIFGTNINLYIGDARNLKYAQDTDKGILVFKESTKQWVSIPTKVKNFLKNNSNDSTKEADFVKLLEKEMENV